MPEIGSKIPDVTVMIMTAGGPAERGSGELLGGGTVVLFGLPGAFTPSCSDHHLPGFVLRAGDLEAKGVDTPATSSAARPRPFSPSCVADARHGNVNR